MDDAVKKLFFNRSPEESLNDLAEAIKDLKSQIERLRNENANLKNEAYKDSELAKMKEERDRAREEMHHGFPISESEYKAINDWKEKHDAEKHNARTVKERMRLEGVCGGRYTYIFVPTTIGTVGKIKCSCGECFTFQDL